MKRIALIAAAAAAIALGGCQQDRCATSRNPTECRAWGDAGGDINDYLVGGMAGYMLANRGGQTVIVRDSGYHGPSRPLHRALMSENAQLRARVERQRVELRRQQAANARKSAALRSSSTSGSRSSYRTSSFRSSFRSSRR